MRTFAEKVIDFNRHLHLEEKLPDKIRVMNPFRENPQAMEVSSAFYKKYYDDHNPRHLILGINPGRFGAGVTGVPFTDTKRMEQYCGIQVQGVQTHEPSSVFIYEVIEAYGGVEKFYSHFYINSPSPLGFVKVNHNNRELNYNYYDSKQLQLLLQDFIIDSIWTHISMGINTDVALCLGTGKNYTYLKHLNDRHQFFDHLVALEHPRYIMQYKSKEKPGYLDKYIRALTTLPDAGSTQ